jgi:hypothetical protein
MGRWKVHVMGGELTDEARAALRDAGIDAHAEREQEGFTATLEATESAGARRRVEAVLQAVDGYSAGAAARAD